LRIFITRGSRSCLFVGILKSQRYVDFISKFCNELTLSEFASVTVHFPDYSGAELLEIAQVNILGCQPYVRHALQHTATHCNTLQHTAAYCNTHCNTLQHTATHCDTLQHTIRRRSCVTCCNSLQLSATHCRTLQHNATHCNTPHAGTVA